MCDSAGRSPVRACWGMSSTSFSYTVLTLRRAGSELSGRVGVRPRRGVLGGALRLFASLARTVLGLRAGALRPLLLLLAQLGGGDAGLLALAVLVGLVGEIGRAHV